MKQCTALLVVVYALAAVQGRALQQAAAPTTVAEGLAQTPSLSTLNTAVQAARIDIPADASWAIFAPNEAFADNAIQQDTGLTAQRLLQLENSQPRTHSSTQPRAASGLRPADQQAVHRQRSSTRKLLNKTTNAADVCKQYNLKVAASSQPPPRLIDCFLMSTEIDMAEIRLRELEHVVDVFVVLESRMTFRGTHRPLHYPRLMNHLPGNVIAKVKYVVLDSLEGNDAWAKEHHQRNALFDVGLKEVQPQQGDIVMVSDCDEIPKPSFLSALKLCEGAQYPLSMQAKMQYYAFDLVSSNDQLWPQPRVTRYSATNFTKAQDLRLGAAVAVYPDSSWHCSYCFSTIAAVQTKLSSFSHAELDTAPNRNPHAIIDKVRAGKDLFLRPGSDFVIKADADMPEFLQAHPTRFSYMITRRTADAGFKDLDQLA